MPIGEDVPMLIPISIVLVIFVMFLIALFINFSERNEIVRMSETSLNLIDISSNVIFSGNLGNLDKDKIESLGTTNTCIDLENLGIDSNYKTTLNITNIETGDWWCWRNFNGYSDAKASVTKSLPFLIDYGDLYDAGKVNVIVEK